MEGTEENQIEKIEQAISQENQLSLNNASEKLDVKLSGCASLLDKILCQYGYGLEMWKIIISIAFIYTVVGYSETIFATLITPYTSHFNLSNGETSMIGIIYFILKATGALFAGNFAKLVNGRIILIRICIIVLLLSNTLLAYMVTKPMLYTERILSGISSGILEPIITNILCEYLPIKLRGFTLLSVWMGFNLGQLYPNLIMLATMPNFEANGISSTLLYSSSLMIICLVITFLLAKDSPRNYILTNREEAGLKILENLTPEKKLTDSQKARIVRELNDGVNREISFTSPWKIIKNEFLLLTILVSLLSLISSLIYDGPVLIMDLTLESIKGNKSQNLVLKEAITVILFSIPSTIIGGLSFEIKYFGRKGTMFFSFLFLIISLILMLIFKGYISIFLGSYIFFANYCSVMITIYCSEVFPSKIRDTSVGLSVFFCYIGSALSQFIFVSLHGLDTFAPYYFSIGCCAIGCVLSCFLTIETYRRPLDINETNKTQNFELSLISNTNLL